MPKKPVSAARVAIVSDTHGQLDARIAALVAECDLAVHAGDIGGAGVLHELQPRGGRVVAVRGNNDVAGKWPEGERRALDELPLQASVELPGGTLVVVHGHRHGSGASRHRRLRTAFPQARGVVYGHSHRLVYDCQSEPWVMNPGASGAARTFGGPSCLILTAEAHGWRLQPVRFPLPARTRAGAGAGL